jgi:hypothetical protein
MSLKDSFGPMRTPGGAADLWLAAGLIGLDVLARVLPHAPSFSPVAASALFAGMVIARRFALAVPIAAMLLSDLILGFDGWTMRLVVYAALTVPAVLGLMARNARWPLAFPLAAASSVIFFVVTNFAVWLTSGMYPLDAAGLAKCYVAALPFFQNTLIGDLLWTAALFGSFWVVRVAFGARRTEQAAA